MLAVCRTCFTFLHNLYNNMPYFILSDNFANVHSSANMYPSILYQLLNAFCNIYYYMLIYILNITHDL